MCIFFAHLRVVLVSARTTLHACVVAMALLWASALVAEEPQSKQERDLAQCLEICSGDSICEKNCQNALGEGAVDGEEECDD